jgi:branched-chain amino acid transport system substrate-binding protein
MEQRMRMLTRVAANAFAVLTMTGLMAAGLFATGTAFGAEPIKIALVQGTSGAVLEVYSRQSQQGFQLGLEYATEGKMEVLGRKIEVITRDTQFKPDVARAALTEVFADPNVVFAVGDSSSGVAKAMLPIAAEAKKILIVEPAVADSLTGADWNPYIFKTSRNSSMDMQAQALALKPGPDLSVATLAEDYAFGKDGISAFRDAMAGTGATIVKEEYVPLQATDLTAPLERIFGALKDRPGRKVVLVYLATVANALGKIMDQQPGRFGIAISTGGNILPVLATYKVVPGMEGAMYYYYEAPKNPVNEWFVKEFKARFNAPPDFFHAGGFAAAMAAVTALKKAGSTDSGKLIAAMEGMSFETPKGKMTFRKEDHQALQSMYHFKIRVDPNVAWAIPDLVREIKPEEMKIPIRNKR